MERTVHPLLSLVEDNRNGLKSVLTHHIDTTVDYQFDLLKNTILRMINHGLIDPLYEDGENDLTCTNEQITLQSTPLTNSIYTEPVKRGFDDDDGEDENDDDMDEVIMNCGNRVNGIGNLVSGNYDNTCGDDVDTEMNEDEFCDTRVNLNATLENNQINSPIINLPDQEDLNDIDKTTANVNNLNCESHLHIPRAKSTNLNFKNKTRQMAKRRTRQNTKSTNKQNNQQSIASTSGLRSSSRKRIPKKVFGDDQSSKTVKKLKRQSDVNDDGTDVDADVDEDDDDDDDDDEGNMYKSNRNVIILELHCIEPDCDLIFPSRLSWREHMKNVHKINRYDLYHHLANNVRLNHLNQTEHFCTYTNCDAVCKSNSVLNKHWSHYHHPGKFACPSCPFVANLYCNVLSHRYAFHGSHKCTYCDKVYTTMSHLKRHELGHTDERPFECTFDNCGLSFRAIGNAYRHVRMRHFNLPKTPKEQRRKNIIDSRDPHEYIRKN